MGRVTAARHVGLQFADFEMDVAVAHLVDDLEYGLDVFLGQLGHCRFLGRRYSTFPGFIKLRGSSAALMVRISSISTGLL